MVYSCARASRRNGKSIKQDFGKERGAADGCALIIKHERIKKRGIPSDTKW